MIITLLQAALRIEDTTHIDVLFGGSRWSVGYLPHLIRCELMRHHLGMLEGGMLYKLIDLVCVVLCFNCIRCFGSI